MTGSRGWKKRDDYRLATTGRRRRKNRKYVSILEEVLQDEKAFLIEIGKL